MTYFVPTRMLAEPPDVARLTQEAKELLRDYLAGDAQVVAEVQANWLGRIPVPFVLPDAELALARAYGFTSWGKMENHAIEFLVRRFDEAARAGDLGQVKAMLPLRWDLAERGNSLMYAMLNRDVAMARVLLEGGAKARTGDTGAPEAMSPLSIARERGYAEMDPLLDGTAFEMEAKPRVGSVVELELAEVWAPLDSWAGKTLLHYAAEQCDVERVKELVAGGADVCAQTGDGATPLDWATHRLSPRDLGRFLEVAEVLLRYGAPMTARAAVAMGDIAFLRREHAARGLTDPIFGSGGLLRLAVDLDRADVLEALLDLGLDPEARAEAWNHLLRRAEHVQGIPLLECALWGKHEMAEMLLRHGAAANGAVRNLREKLSPMECARDWAMVELLMRYGGVPFANLAGLLRNVEAGRRMLDGELACQVERGHGVAEDIVTGAALGGGAEVLRLAVERLDWGREDHRWFPIVESTMLEWTTHPGGDAPNHLECLRLLLERCDVNLRGRMMEGEFGVTFLHRVVRMPGGGVAFAKVLLDAGARMDLREGLFRSTPLGWACRWGRVELVRLLLERGADAEERGAEPWTRPMAWAEKTGRMEVAAVLRERTAAGW